jgi:hypothetical protein
MANVYSANPIILDTFTSAIDVGDSAFGNSYMPFFIESIEWQTPAAANDTAAITDGAGAGVYNETCVVAKQSIIKYYNGGRFQGIKIATSGVSSGKIIIQLR